MVAKTPQLNLQNSLSSLMKILYHQSIIFFESSSNNWLFFLIYIAKFLYQISQKNYHSVKHSQSTKKGSATILFSSSSPFTIKKSKTNIPYNNIYLKNLFVIESIKLILLLKNFLLQNILSAFNSFLDSYISYIISLNKVTCPILRLCFLLFYHTNGRALVPLFLFYQKKMPSSWTQFLRNFLFFQHFLWISYIYF